MSQPDHPACPCPKCGRTLEASGELTINLPDGQAVTVPTYQCDECLMTVDFGGEPLEIAVTFARRSDGTIFDPADPEEELRF